jgi:AraC-like DNA-binding protein
LNLNQQILFLLSGLGAFNALLLSPYLLFTYRKKGTLSGMFLAILLLAIGLRAGKSVFLVFNPQLPLIYIQIGLSACFFIGPALYYFFRSAVGKVTQMPARWKWSWAALAGFMLIIGLVFPLPLRRDVWNAYIIKGIYLQWGLFLIATGIYLYRAKAFANWRGEREQFWMALYGGNCLICLIYVLAMFHIGYYISAPLSFTMLLFVILGFTRYKSVLHDELPKAPKKKIEDGTAQRWLQQLELLMKTGQLYKDPSLNLATLAGKINITTHQLSQLLNDNLGKSFATYINEYRIRTACEMIMRDRHLTFEAIGYEVGYNSKSTFYAAFKKVTDTTPALYKESFDNQSV